MLTIALISLTYFPINTNRLLSINLIKLNKETVEKEGSI